MNSDAIFERVMENVRAPAPALNAMAAAAQSGEEALDGFLRVFTSHYAADMDRFRAVFVDGASTTFRPSEEQLCQLHAVNDELFGPIVRKLTDAWGAGELPHGIHPRRLVFVGYLATIGLLTMKNLTETIGDPLLHSDEELIDELSRALASPTTVMRQLAALNDASTELGAIRSESELLERVPDLLCKTLGFEEASVSFEPTVNTTAVEGSTVTTPLRAHGEIVGMLTACSSRIDRRDVSRLEMFANMVALALDNVRFYASLEAQVEQRTKQLRDAQAALVQSEKMAALGKLVAGVAHELNTPIGAMNSTQQSMRSAIDKLEASIAAGDEKRVATLLAMLRNSANVIEDGSGRVDTIVQRLERFARLDRAQREHAQINECIEDAIAAAALGDSVELLRDYGELPDIACSPGALNQVFLNLLSNAAQAMPKGGRVTITTAANDSDVEICIRDDGEGIAAEHLATIYDPGFTTRGVGVGSGLGLSICHQIVSQHRGDIAIESELGVGTVVRLRLPRSG